MSSRDFSEGCASGASAKSALREPTMSTQQLGVCPDWCFGGTLLLVVIRGRGNRDAGVSDWFQFQGTLFLERHRSLINPEAKT